MSHTISHTDGRPCSGLTKAGRPCRNLAYRSIGASETSDHRPYCSTHTDQGETVAARAAALDAMPTGEEWGDVEERASLAREDAAGGDEGVTFTETLRREARATRPCSRCGASAVDPIHGGRDGHAYDVEPVPYSDEVRDEVYARAGLPTPEMGAALAAGIAKEAERLGYASTAEYLWAPGRLSPSVLDRVEEARQRAVVEAVPMTPEAGRAHVEAAVVAAATRDPEDARALVDDGRDLAEERAVAAEADEEAAGELAHLDTQARLAAALRDQSSTAVEQVQRFAGRILADAEMRLVPDGFRLLLLDRAGHVAALAARTVAAVEDTGSYDLAEVVNAVGVSYLAEVGSRTRDTGTAEFAAGRVALAARQVLDGHPVSV